VIDESRAEKAVDYLRDTAKEYGQHCGRMAYATSNLRRVKSLQMLQAPPGSVADREAFAYASDAYKAAMEDEQNAVADRETMRAMRDAAEFTFELWRSQNSTRRAAIP
jgi:hypothetical protein